MTSSIAIVGIAIVLLLLALADDSSRPNSIDESKSESKSDDSARDD